MAGSPRSNPPTRKMPRLSRWRSPKQMRPGPTSSSRPIRTTTGWASPPAMPQEKCASSPATRSGRSSHGIARASISNSESSTKRTAKMPRSSRRSSPPTSRKRSRNVSVSAASRPSPGSNISAKSSANTKRRSRSTSGRTTRNSPSPGPANSGSNTRRSTSSAAKKATDTAPRISFVTRTATAPPSSSPRRPPTQSPAS